MNMTLDTRHHFRGLHGSPSHCRLRIYEGSGSCEPSDRNEAEGGRSDSPPVAVVTECPDNPGTSVTNFAEGLAAAVWRMLGCPRSWSGSRTTRPRPCGKPSSPASSSRRARAWSGSPPPAGTRWTDGRWRP